MFNDEKLGGFFDQLVSYQILLDLLYESGRYQDILDTYKIIKDRQVSNPISSGIFQQFPLIPLQIQGGRYPKHVLVLTFAACYKLNTPQSFEFAKTLWTELNEAGHYPMRRATTFMAALALNQEQPEIALEVVSIVKQQNYLTVRTIKALAFAMMGRFDDAVPILRSVLEVDNPMANKQTFPSDVIEELKKRFEGVKSKDIQADFTKVVGFLEKHGHVSKDTLSGILCSEIVQTMQSPGTGRDDPRFQSRDDFRGPRRDDRRGGFQRREFDYPSGRARRPGLHELN
jgi:pentatricopeptide repeat domain-containing protein 2